MTPSAWSGPQLMPGTHSGGNTQEQLQFIHLRGVKCISLPLLVSSLILLPPSSEREIAVDLFILCFFLFLRKVTSLIVE